MLSLLNRIMFRSIIFITALELKVIAKGALSMASGAMEVPARVQIMKIRVVALLIAVTASFWAAPGFAEKNDSLLRLESSLVRQPVTPQFVYAPAEVDINQIAQLGPEHWRTLDPSSVQPKPGYHGWLRFSVQNDSDQTQHRWMVIEWPLLQHLQMHLLTSEGELRWSSRPVGENYPLENRYRLHRHFLFPVSLEAGEQLTVYLDVHSRMVSVVPIEIWAYEAFVEADQLHLVIVGGMFGALVIMFFYNLNLFVLLRDRVYLYYCIYMAAVTSYLLVTSGLGVLYLWDGLPWFKLRSMSFLAGLAFFSTALFIRHFLAVRKYGGWVLFVNTAYLWVSGSALVFALIFPPNPILLAVMNLVALTGIVASTVTGVYLWLWKRAASAKIFVLAWTILNVGTLVIVLMLEGIFPLNIWTRYSQMAGVVVEMAIISMALANRINEAKLAQARADQEALRLSQQISEERAERLRVQIESLEAQKKLNEELELRVQKRTEQLNETLHKLEQANAELRQLSTLDPLTNVYNRRYLDEMLAVECKRANRSGQNLALVLLDIDHFKPINDRYGHAVGDKCLRAVAEALAGVAKRPGDMLARYGGEEFVLVLPNTDEAQAARVAEEGRAAVAALALDHEGTPLPLTISAGIAARVPAGNDMANRLLRDADRALYKAKDEGRNRVVKASQLQPEDLSV